MFVSFLVSSSFSFSFSFLVFVFDAMVFFLCGINYYDMFYFIYDWNWIVS